MRLVFIYNAKSGVQQGLFNLAHKILSPDTYNCSLCKLTHGAFTSRKEWTEFMKSYPHELEFYHLDEFESRYPERFNYPVVLEVRNGNLKVVLSAKEINKLENVKGLIRALERHTQSKTD